MAQSLVNLPYEVCDYGAGTRPALEKQLIKSIKINILLHTIYITFIFSLDKYAPDSIV